MKRRTNDIERDNTIIDASLNSLKGDGPKTKDVLFQIRAGNKANASIRLAAARYEDWKESTRK